MMRSPPKILIWLAPAALLACTAILSHKALETRDAAPRPTVNHKLHIDNDLFCSDCHDPEETGTPAMPKAETCFECHEKLDEENERVQAYFATARQADGTYRFQRPAYMADLIPNHKGHADYKVDCSACHGEVSEQAFARPDPLEFMARCQSCHTQRKAIIDCAVCHKETRKDAKPASHDQAWETIHGKRKDASCEICHAVPQDCDSCHRETKPTSHSEAGWERNHGRGDAADLDLPFKERSCALCHEKQSCVLCHQTTKPANHTSAWVRRLHGIDAAIERQSCRTCHQQDSCVRCHKSTEPVTHKGSFLSGPQAHCLGCHDPLPSNGCYVCHKNTVGHLQATPLPAGPPHNAATDCRTCHSVLQHFDDGGNCRRCHR